MNHGLIRGLRLASAVGCYRQFCLSCVAVSSIVLFKLNVRPHSLLRRCNMSWWHNLPSLIFGWYFLACSLATLSCGATFSFLLGSSHVAVTWMLPELMAFLYGGPRTLVCLCGRLNKAAKGYGPARATFSPSLLGPAIPWHCVKVKGTYRSFPQTPSIYTSSTLDTITTWLFTAEDCYAYNN